jgi:hypothetical protein
MCTCSTASALERVAGPLASARRLPSRAHSCRPPSSAHWARHWQSRLLTRRPDATLRHVLAWRVSTLVETASLERENECSQAAWGTWGKDAKPRQRPEQTGHKTCPSWHCQMGPACIFLKQQHTARSLARTVSRPACSYRQSFGGHHSTPHSHIRPRLRCLTLPGGDFPLEPSRARP